MGPLPTCPARTLRPPPAAALTAKSANNPKEPIINAKDLVAKHLKRKLAEL